MIAALEWQGADVTPDAVVGASGTIDIDLTLRYRGRATPRGPGDVALIGALRLIDTVRGVAGTTIARLQYRRPKRRVIVGAALDLAALVVATGSTDWRGVTVTRGESKDLHPHCHVLTVSGGPDEAKRLLDVAVELRVAALRGAVPVFEQSSYAMHHGEFDEETLFGNEYTSGDLSDDETRFVWATMTMPEVMALSPSPVELASMLWGAVEAFVTTAKLQAPRQPLEGGAPVTAATFDLTGPLPTGRTLIEASAGTGKTYSIATLVTRYVAGELAGPAAHDLAEGVDIGEVLVVTFTRAAASELRDRIRRMMSVAADYLDGSGQGEPWMSVLDGGTRRVHQRRSARLRGALARFDEATITTIHGFCQQATAQSGIRAAGDPGVELVEDNATVIAEVCRDLVLPRLLENPLALSTDRNDNPVGPTSTKIKAPSKVEGYIAQAVRAVLTNPGAQPVPGADPDTLHGQWAATVAGIVGGVAARQRARRQVGYDRLISDLRDLLADPDDGPALAQQLAHRYRLVLVDEFQDTDRLQWEVFDRAFGNHRLITVGDPKQAIYRFRGADVHAYLEAVRHVRAHDARHQPPVRSTTARRARRALPRRDPRPPRHPFRRVDAAPDRLVERARRRRRAPHPRSSRTTTSRRPHVERAQLGARPAHRRSPTSPRGSGACSTTGTITDANGRVERVRPSDIAVLVPSQRRAADVAAVLREWSIPSVRSRTGSVLDSDSATQWRLLLGGLANPTRARVARAAGLGWFFDLPPAELAENFESAGFETPLAALQRRLAMLGDRLRTSGVGAFYEELRAESGVLPRVLSRPNGDRNAADLDHIADLLTEATHGTTSEPLQRAARARRPDRGGAVRTHDAAHRDRRRGGPDHHDPLGQGARVPHRARPVRVSRAGERDAAVRVQHRAPTATSTWRRGSRGATNPRSLGPPPRAIAETARSRRSTATTCGCCTSRSPAPSTGSSCGGRRRPVRGRRRWGGCCSTGSARGRWRTPRSVRRSRSRVRTS